MRRCWLPWRRCKETSKRRALRHSGRRSSGVSRRQRTLCGRTTAACGPRRDCTRGGSTQRCLQSTGVRSCALMCADDILGGKWREEERVCDDVVQLGSLLTRRRHCNALLSFPLQATASQQPQLSRYSHRLRRLPRWRAAAAARHNPYLSTFSVDAAASCVTARARTLVRA